MLTWAENRSGKTKHQEQLDGTFASLVRIYDTHDDSPCHDLVEVTQTSYSTVLLMKHKGERRVDGVIGNDIRRWYRELKAHRPVGRT